MPCLLGLRSAQMDMRAGDCGIWHHPVSPFQGFDLVTAVRPRALPWAGLFSSFRAWVDGRGGGDATSSMGC